PVFGRHDAMHARTCRHFITKGPKTGGNMYPTGSHVCPWYAGKMALSMIWLADDVEPYRWMKDAAQAIGHFGETFEINEPGLRRTPWFTTGAGTCLFAVNQMLLCDAEGELWLGMGVPKDWTDYAGQRWAVRGGAGRRRPSGGACGHAPPPPGGADGAPAPAREAARRVPPGGAGMPPAGARGRRGPVRDPAGRRLVPLNAAA
ncbi:MAG: hypothetical protein Q4D70_06815, partial [bacterium]|nr:hypothetical protein [bacterium]